MAVIMRDYFLMYTIREDSKKLPYLKFVCVCACVFKTKPEFSEFQRMLPTYFLKVNFDREKKQQAKNNRRKEKHPTAPHLTPIMKKGGNEDTLAFGSGSGERVIYSFQEAQHPYVKHQQSKSKE